MSNVSQFIQTALGYYRQNLMEQAAESFEKAINTEPSALAHYGLAVVLDRLGNPDRSKTHAESALKIDPRHADASTLLTSLVRRQKDLIQALSIVSSALTHASQHAGLHYEMGFVLQDLKRYDEAYKYFETANRLQNRKAVSRDQYLDEINGITVFLEKIEKHSLAPELPRSTSGPMFLVGSPRSGTTLLAEMLGMHSKIKNAGELEIVTQVYQEANRLLRSPNHVGKILESLWHPNNAALPNLLRQYYAKLLEKIPNDSKEWILDKLPSNARRVGMIKRIAPGAPIIHIIRDGREVAFSAFTQNFQKDTWHSHDLGDALVEWETTIRLARESARILKVPYHEVFYERLVADPRKILGEALDFLGLDWENDCLNYHQSRSRVDTASYHQVRQNIFTSSLHKAKNYPKQYAMMTEMVGKTLRELGYET